MRTEGRPSDVALATAMALGSFGSALSASANQPRTCSNGSGMLGRVSWIDAYVAGQARQD
jgi:hypothetical protein